jgi:hypothetical protein
VTRAARSTAIVVFLACAACTTKTVVKKVYVTAASTTTTTTTLPPATTTTGQCINGLTNHACPPGSPTYTPPPSAPPPPVTFSTGVYQVGVDIPSGDYRTTSSDNGGHPYRCYWARLDSANTDSVHEPRQWGVDVGYGGPVTVHVVTPYFRTEGCLFVKVGG